MRITVIGATGMVGSRVVAEAADRGHRAIAISRTAPRHHRAEVTSVQADASSAPELDRALAGGRGSNGDDEPGRADAIVLTVRADPGEEDAFITITEEALIASARIDVPLLVVGGAGPLKSPNNPEVTVIDNPDFVPPQWRSIAAASVAQLASCTAHPSARWAYLSPPAVLEPGPRTGTYQRGTTTLLTDENGLSHISVEDLAVAVLDEFESPGIDRHITVAADHRDSGQPRRG